MNELWLPIALPLFGALFLLLAGRRSNAWGHLLACATALASFAIGLVLFADMLGRDTTTRPVTEHLYSWIPVGGLNVEFALHLDQLSMCFLLLVTGVGSLIHLYSVGYMKTDPQRRKFFAYLNLFLAAMLTLVLAANYLVLYLGWEGVGLASYLLIGFWQHRPAAAAAAKKAFVVNRVGDTGLLVAMMVMFATFGSVGFGPVFAGAPHAGSGTVTILGLLLLLAACGKSAQVPLQSWLGDAMEGPTPVSALIHAATMVTAGVYLIARSGPIFDLSSGARLAVGIIGTITLLFGAIIGCAKDDIKKALAASTMSQIGYMVLAAGLGPVGYVFAIMHLLTHGFFKAGLFLGAGSVMHGMGERTDMRGFGGLRTVMPITFVTFGLGYLAIIGIPPFSGFFSKDKIIEAAFDSGGASGTVFGIAAIIGAGLTAFYMSRVMFLTFFGRARWRDLPPEQRPHPHEAPASMTGPMIVLAIGSACAGGLFVAGASLQNWLSPVLGAPPEHHGGVPSWGITVITLAVVLAGLGLAWTRFGTRPVPAHPPDPAAALVVAARRDLYGDAFNEAVFMRPGARLTDALVVADDEGVDGAVSGIAESVRALANRVVRWQTGYVRSYALSMFLGAAGALAILLLVRFS